MKKEDISRKHQSNTRPNEKNQTARHQNAESQNDETAEAKNTNPLNASNIFSDVLGSYTGVPEDGGPPVQDTDDL